MLPSEAQEQRPCRPNGRRDAQGAASEALGNLFLAIELVQSGLSDLTMIATACYLSSETIEEIAAAHARNIEVSCADKRAEILLYLEMYGRLQIKNKGRRGRPVAEDRVYRERRLQKDRSYIEYETPGARKRRLTHQRNYQREYRKRCAADPVELERLREYNRQYQRMWRARRRNS